jgi:predicted DNA-binding ribbon-helix-helix protein
MTVSELAAIIDADRQHNNLSSAIRLFVLGFYRDQISDHRTRPVKDAEMVVDSATSNMTGNGYAAHPAGQRKQLVA